MRRVPWRRARLKGTGLLCSVPLRGMMGKIKSAGYACRTVRRRLVDAGSNPASSTNTQNPNPHRLGFFLPVHPVLARFPGLASRAPPLRSRRFRPRRRLSVLRFLWWSRERSRGHFLCWRGFRCGRLWSATPVAVATDGDKLHSAVLRYGHAGVESGYMRPPPADPGKM